MNQYGDVRFPKLENQKRTPKGRSWFLKDTVFANMKTNGEREKMSKYKMNQSK